MELPPLKAEESHSALAFQRMASMRQPARSIRTTCPAGQVVFEHRHRGHRHQFRADEPLCSSPPREGSRSPEGLRRRRSPVRRVGWDMAGGNGSTWGGGAQGGEEGSGAAAGDDMYDALEHDEELQVGSEEDGEDSSSTSQSPDGGTILSESCKVEIGGRYQVQPWTGRFSGLFKGASKIRMRVAAAALITVFTTAVTSLIIAGGTRQVLISSVNKSLGQLARIDSSVVETEFALTAITGTWACDAFRINPGLGYAVDGSVEVQSYVIELLSQNLTAGGLLVAEPSSGSALAAYYDVEDGTATWGLINPSTDGCWLTWRADAKALVPLPGRQMPATTDCQFRQSGRYDAMVSASQASTLVADPFTGVLKAASRSDCGTTVVTAYSTMVHVAEYLRNSTSQSFRGFRPDLGVQSRNRRRDTHEFLVINTNPSDMSGNIDNYYVVMDSHANIAERILASTTPLPLSQAPKPMRIATRYLAQLNNSAVGIYNGKYFMAAEPIRADMIKGSLFAQPMYLVVVVPESEFLGFMINLIVVNFIVCLLLFGVYLALLGIGIQQPARREDSTWRKIRCMVGSIWACDPEHEYIPIALILIMLIITAGLWRGALDQDLASYRRDWISHHSSAISSFIQTFTGMSLMAFQYALQLYKLGRFPLPPTPATIDQLDTAFVSIHRPMYPYAGVNGIYVGLDTDEMSGAGFVYDNYAVRAKDPTTDGIFTWYGQQPNYVRDLKRVLATAPDYSVLKRDWFNKVDPTGKISFLPPYHFHSFVGFGMAWNSQVNITFGGQVHKTVLAVETLVIQFSEKLAHFNSLAGPGMEGEGDALYIVDRTGLMIASSDKVVTKGEPGVGVNAKDQRISPLESPNAVVKLTYDALVRWMGQPDQWNPPVSLVVNQDGEEGPYVTSVTSIDGGGKNWLLVMAYPDTESRKLEPILIMTLILCLAVGLVILYITTALFDALGHSDAFSANRGDDEDDDNNDDGQHGALVRYIFPRVSGRGYTALTFIRLSWNSMNALELLRLDSKGGRIRPRLYRLLHHRGYALFILLTILAFLLLAFFEAPIDMRRAPFNPDYLRSITITASVILIILTLDSAVWIATMGVKVPSYDHKHDEVIVKPDPLPIIYALALLIFIVDLFLVGEGYYNHAMVENEDQGQMVVMLLPHTAFLRPLLLLLRFREARHMAQRFLATILKALPVLGLFVLLIILTSAMSNLLFAGRSNTNLPGTGFDTIMSSFVQSFVMSTSGDNWGDVVNSITTCAGQEGGSCTTPTWVFVYFIIVSLIGTMLTVSLLIQAFQQYYVSVHREHLELVEADRDVNMVAAFCVLDEDNNGQLDMTEFSVLLRDMASTSGMGIKVVLERRPEDMFVSLPTFLRLARRLEPLGWFRPYYHKVGQKYTDDEGSPSNEPDRAPSFTRVVSVLEAKGDWMDRVASKVFGRHPVYLLLIVNFTTIALYGYTTTPWMLQCLDCFNLFLLCYWAAEPLYPVIRYGFRLYWHVDDDFYLQTTRRFVFLTTVPPLIALIISRAVMHSFLWSPWTLDPHNDPTRVVLTIPLVRVLVILRGLRRMSLGLMMVVHELGEQLAGCALISFSFAATGCRLFAGKLGLLSSYAGGTLNFDSMRSSWMLLYNIFISGNVTEVLQGIMDTGSLVIGLLYFLLYLFSIDIIYLNLLTSVVCQLYEATQQVNDAAEQAGRPFTSLEFWLKFSTYMRSAVKAAPASQPSLHDPDFEVTFPEASYDVTNPVDWTVHITLKDTTGPRQVGTPPRHLN